ncbi:MAG: methyltransferase domain-containing protein [Scytonematopsis contorta HA4267-MV1]|jgi:GT2 family glycosyltransferase/2-polyprenyl-3-methyl-5-hydroxy-6-metoxy-1,4-benzoquinol methylase|nr:methyltransferase domain-containing protein [Scytonematopsis contorta HA4267-MV1]
MESNFIKNYPTFEDLNEESIDKNSSLKKMLRFIGDNKRVVDFGCATGNFAQLLSQKGCIVTGVDINPEVAQSAKKYCEDFILADLDFVSVTEILADNEYDVAIFGDVLEHLKNPWKVLEETKNILKKDGYVVASIPNIAHGAIRLALLQGRFEYMKEGILDNTHLRFFTRKTVEDLFEKSGYLVTNIDKTVLNFLSDSDLIPKINISDFQNDIFQQINNDEDANTLQFIICAVPSTLEVKYITLNEKYSHLLLEYQKLKCELILNQEQLEHSQLNLQDKNTEILELQSQLGETEDKLSNFSVSLQQAQQQFEYSQASGEIIKKEQEKIQEQLLNSQREQDVLRQQLHQYQRQFLTEQQQKQKAQLELEYSNIMIAAMKTSKFWVLRTLWFRIKEPVIKYCSRLINKLNGTWKVAHVDKLKTNISNREIIVEEVSLPQPLYKHTVSVDIIVCVHNALDDVKRCLESVIHYTGMPYSLILVDDGSSKETCEYLSEFSNSQGCFLIRNEVAKGYTFAANQGLKQSQADYVVLLNSDTVVTPEWLDRMVACGESDPKIGIIGPLSNTASWQSIPEITQGDDWAENCLPQEITVTDMGCLVASYSQRLYPRISFLNGFCLMIKRSVILEIGYFDEVSFGAGYGEENDYCLRARKAEWQLAVADDTYIYHSQSRSYSHERRKMLCERADKVLISKHGQKIVSEGVTICRFDRVMEGIRARSQVMKMRQKFVEDGKLHWGGKRILIVLPITEPGGGGNVIFQEAEAMQNMGVDVRIVNFQSNKSSFERSYPKSNIPIIYVDNENQISCLLTDCDAAIATLYKSVYWLKSQVSNANLPIKGYYVQDFEPYFFPSNSEEYKTAWNSYSLYPDLVRVTKTQWNYEVVKDLIGIDCSIVGASVNIDLFRPRRRRDKNWPQRPLRVAAMIRPSSPRRAAKLTMEILQQVSQVHGDNIEIIIFGCNSDDHLFLELPHHFPYSNAGILNRSQLAFLLNEVDIFIDLSTFQAMGLTAMEAMACGVAVVVPNKGGASSFARHEVNSLIVDTSSKNACFTQVNRLIFDERLRAQLQKQGLKDICQYSPEKAAYNTLNSLFIKKY